MKYSVEWARKRFALDPSVPLVFFWGHTRTVGKMTKACLSQWYPASFVVDGLTYRTAEQYMMAEKARLFHDEGTCARIMAVAEPYACKKLGRLVSGFDATVWDRHKGEIVVRGSIAKFSQNAELKEFLLGTGNAIIVEASPYDAIWGVKLSIDDPLIRDPRNWRGENLLGFSLMEARDALREAELRTGTVT